MTETAAARLERTMSAEFEERLRTITFAISAALIAISALVWIVAPPEIATRTMLLVSIFAIMHWGVYGLFRAGWGGWWLLFAVTALDFALLTYSVLSQPSGGERTLPTAFMLRFDGFTFLYVMLASLVIYFRPSLILWGGLCGAACWAVAIYIVSGLAPESVYLGPSQSMHELFERYANPYYIDFDVQFQNTVIFLIVAGLLATSTEASMRLLRRHVASERRAANLSRYLPAETVEAMASRDDPFAENDEREAAVMFTDIVGFSALAERRSPREVIALLTEAHGLVEAEVHAHGGVLDKFIGDGAMATFGAAGGTEGAAANAVACVASIRSANARWNETRQTKGEEPVSISVGVHFGPVVVGDVGAARRTELAVIGDVVNVASRLEHMTRALGVGAAVSDDAMVAAGRPGGFADLGVHTIKGREGEVRVWGLAN